jgi:cupin superfamily acireductone dioxygenase involved in methionine salvage
VRLFAPLKPFLARQARFFCLNQRAWRHFGWQNKATDFVPFHKHPNEISGYVISGKYNLKFDGQEYTLSTGDTYSIPANVEHSIEIIEAGEVVDVFSPIRQDYL